MNRQNGPAEERADVDVRAAWSAALGVAEAGPDDDFFDCGGTSLGALRLISRLKAASGVTITLRDLLEHRTPRALGALLRMRAGC